MTGPVDTLTIRRPDDWHVHLRDGAALSAVVPHTARGFGRALAMPNLVPPVRTVEDARAYRARILAATPPDSGFSPMLALYLTDRTTPAEVRAAADESWLIAAKLYPAGATTHSDAGVTDVARLDPVLDAMAEAGLALCVHGELTEPEVDIYDREAAFLDAVLAPLVARHPRLRVVLEHVTTAQGVAFVEAAREGVAATITAHHLLLNRNAVFLGGLRPHHHCLPVLKRERHRLELVRAATSGSPRFFLGTDSAPHPRGAKESACGCAGVFTAPHALPLYAEAFERAAALHALEGFASVHGAAFYGLPVAEQTVTLTRAEAPVPEHYPLGDDVVVPLRAGGATRWSIAP